MQVQLFRLHLLAFSRSFVALTGVDGCRAVIARDTLESRMCQSRVLILLMCTRIQNRVPGRAPKIQSCHSSSEVGFYIVVLCTFVF